MKKMVLLAVLFAAMPLMSMAQDDDLYFNPKMEAKKAAAEREKEAKEIAAHYSGSNRDVDEYNRHGRFVSRFQKIGTDSLGNDIITFRIGKGVAPDSIYDDAQFVQKYIDKYADDDFAYTRDFSRWDGYYNPWFYDYYGVGPYYWRSAYWGWRNPWRYGYYAGWYDPWFDPFYDPWYYGYAGWYGGWYSPWYYGWGGYYSPWYWGGPVYSHVSYGGRNSAGYAGSRSFRFNGGESGGKYGNASGNSYTYRSQANRQFGGRTDNSTNRYNTTRSNQNNSTSFNRSNFGGFGNRSGASFSGGARSGGGSFGGGGARSGGGFGGRR